MKNLEIHLFSFIARFALASVLPFFLLVFIVFSEGVEVLVRVSSVPLPLHLYFSPRSFGIDVVADIS